MADKCNAFVIARIGDGEAFFETIFPGHSYVKWKEDQPDPSRRVEQAIAFVEKALQDQPDQPIRKGDIKTALGATKQDMTRVYRDPQFCSFLAKNSYEAHQRGFRLIQSQFDPIED